MAARIAGISLREIAEHEACSIEEIETAVVRMSGGVSPHFRERHMQLSLERLDKLLRAHYQKAVTGDYDSSVIYIRTVELSCRLLGLFPPPQSDASLDKLRPQTTSTEKIREVFDALIGKTDRVIEGEAVENPSDNPVDDAVQNGGQDGADE